MKYNIQALLFDLDGVVVFTDRYHYHAWKMVCSENGWEFNEEINHKLRGVSRMESLQIILDHNQVEVSSENKDEIAARKNSYYVKYLKDINDGDIYPGVIDFIKKARDKGVKTAICSSSKNAEAILQMLKIDHFFDAIVSGNDIQKTKPDPEIFLTGAEKLNIHPLNCMVFEDAPTGIQAAKAAKMKCIGVGSYRLLNDVEECITSYEEIDLDELLIAGRVMRIPVEPWSIVETKFNQQNQSFWGSIFALSNGYMGLRGSFEEDDPYMQPYTTQGMFINSIYSYEDFTDIFQPKGAPKGYHGMLNLFDWTVINLTIEDEVFSMFSGSIHDYRRELDMKNGVVSRSLIWESPKGRKVHLKSTRLISMVQRHNAAICYKVKPINFSGKIILESCVKHWVKNKQFGEHPVKKIDNGMVGDISYFIYNTDVTNFKIGLTIGHSINSTEVVNTSMNFDQEEFKAVFSTYVNQGDTINLEKHAAVYSTFETQESNLIAFAEENVRSALHGGFKELYKKQCSFWNSFWKMADIEVKGNHSDQQALRFNIFHMRQSHPEDDRRSISATGMTGVNYGGHVFWDTEMYMIPVFNYTEPELVRPLLMYRYNILDSARERAAQMDGKGALYSWMSINGEETNISWECATAQYHINSDIAYAIWRYYRATNDKEFIFKYGAEILFETTRFLFEKGKFIEFRSNRFCINMVCGPDEYGCSVNNNTYTNMMVQFHFYFAIEIYKLIKNKDIRAFEKLCKKIKFSEYEIQSWQKAADNMYVNFNEQLGIHEQDDSYLYKDPVDMNTIPRNIEPSPKHPLNKWKLQITKQADVVLLMFVLGNKFDKKVKKKNFDFYEPRTNHGSSLSPSIHSIIASEVGYRDMAYEFFQQTLYLDLKNLRRNTDGGIHLASVGGTWMAVVNGFVGMRDYEDELIFNPYIPEQWDSYRFKLKYRGRLIEIYVDKEKSEFRLLKGDKLEIKVNDQWLKLLLDEIKN